MATTDVFIKLAVQGAGVATAELGKLETGLGTLGGAASTLKSVMATLGVSLTAAAFVDMVGSSINATGALHDLAIQTGASEAALSEFRKAGAYTGTSIDTITGALTKLSKNMILASEDSKGAGIVIKALGIDFDAFMDMKPDERMLAVAVAMDKFADGADKSAGAQALFGKEGAKLLPFLRDLAENVDTITAKLTDEQVALKAAQAAMADAFGDNLIQIRKESDGWKRDLAEGMTPALYEASAAFLDVTKGTEGFKAKISELSKDGSITEWTRTGITALSYIVEGLEFVVNVFKSTGLVIAAQVATWVDHFRTAGEAISLFTKGDFSLAMEALDAGATRQSTISKALTDDLEATWGAQTFGLKLRDRMTDLEGVGAASKAIKPDLDVSAELDKAATAHAKTNAEMKTAAADAKAHAAELKTQDTNLISLTKNLDLQLTALQSYIEKGEKIGPADKAENELMIAMKDSMVALTDKQLSATLQKIDLLRETEKQVDAIKKEATETAAAVTAHADLVDKMQKSTTEISDATTKTKDHIVEMTLSKEQLILLVGEKENDRAKTLEQKAAWAEIAGLDADVVQGYKDQASALRDLATVKKEEVHLKIAREAAEEWEKTTKSIASGLANAIMSGWESGKSAFVIFRDFLIAQFKNLVLTPTINFLVTPLANAINGALAGVTGSIAGALGIPGLGSGGSGGSVEGGNILSAAAGPILGIGGTGFTGTGLSGTLGIGASAGAGVTTSAVSAGSAVGVDLGLLGAEGTAAASGGAAALEGELLTLGPYGWMAAAAIALYAMFGGPGKPAQNTGSEKRTYAADGSYLGGQTYYGGTSANTTAVIDGLEGAYLGSAQALGIPPQKVTFKFLTNTGDNGENPMFGLGGGAGDDVAWEQGESHATEQAITAASHRAVVAALIGSGPTEAQRAAIFGMYPDVPAYARGGLFGGGIRLVGERGPELEVTGPSRIFDAEQTASLLRSGGASDSEVVKELQMLRRALEQNAINTQQTNRTLDRIAPQGDAMSVRVVT